MKTKIWLPALILCFASGVFFELPAAQALTSTANSPASAVIGQSSISESLPNQGGTPAANTLNSPAGVWATGSKLIIWDGSPFGDPFSNHRILVFNSTPTGNNASADVVIGQPDMTSNSANQGGDVGANTLNGSGDILTIGSKLILSDLQNNRVLIYNSIPTEDDASADVVIGQPDMTSGSENQGGTAGANTLFSPGGVYSDGTRLIIADSSNNRVLIYNTIPTSDNASADVVIGQPDMTSNSANQGGGAGANTLNFPGGVYSDGTRLIIADSDNHRVLIYNSIPTEDDASADVVIGQPDMVSSAANQGGGAGANTMNNPIEIHSDETRLFVTDMSNNRVLIFNTIPTEDDASADVVIGQPDMTSNGANQGGTAGANTLVMPSGLHSDGTRLFVGDFGNSRFLIYKLKPTLSETTPVDSTTDDKTPSVTFSTDEAGTISYSGGCTSETASATEGDNTITFSALEDGQYSNCAIQVTDGAGYASSPLILTPFKVDTATDSPENTNSPNTNIASDNSVCDITSNIPALNYTAKNIKRKITFTFNCLSLSRTKNNKSKNISIKLNDKRVRPIRVRSFASSNKTKITVKFNYRRWTRGSYDLSMSYKYKEGKGWVRGSRAKADILTIN